MPARPASTSNELAEFLRNVAWLEPTDSIDAEMIVEEHERIGEISVEDANEAGWMVPEGQAFLVRTAKAGSFLVEISEIV